MSANNSSASLWSNKIRYSFQGQIFVSSLFNKDYYPSSACWSRPLNDNEISAYEELLNCSFDYIPPNDDSVVEVSAGECVNGTNAITSSASQYGFFPHNFVNLSPSQLNSLRSPRIRNVCHPAMPNHPAYPDVLQSFPIFPSNEPLWLVRNDPDNNNQNVTIPPSNTFQNIATESFSVRGAIAPAPTPAYSLLSVGSGRLPWYPYDNFGTNCLASGVFYFDSNGRHRGNRPAVVNVQTPTQHYNEVFYDNLFMVNEIDEMGNTFDPVNFHAHQFPLPVENRNLQYINAPEYHEVPFEALQNVDQIPELLARPKRKRPLPQTRVTVTDENGLLIKKQTTLIDLAEFLVLFKELRNEYHLSQKDVTRSLAIKYNCQFSQATISRFEAGTLSTDNLNILCPLFENWVKQFKELFPTPENLPSDWDLMLADFPCEVLRFLPPNRQRNPRRKFSNFMKSFLEEKFLEMNRPSKTAIDEMAQRLQLEPNVIRVWFSNRRRALKRNQDKKPKIKCL